MERHFTASVYIVGQQGVLLIFHRKLNKWLPPGGHLEPDETPPEGARREVREETGLEIEFIPQENLWIERWNASSFERPYLCLIAEVPAYQNTPAHQHLDFVYLAKAVGGKESMKIDEIDKMRWFTLEEIDALEADVEIFVETQQIIKNIFNSPLIYRQPVEMTIISSFRQFQDLDLTKQSQSQTACVQE